MNISGATRLAAVIGHPVTHSLSPALHNAAFEASGIDWRFVAFEVATGGADAAIAAMRTLGIGGFAVTMPHKEEVAAAVDEIDPAARALRSVNTVVLRDDGSTLGASTDGAGFVASLLHAGLQPDRVAIVGAGAAARSIVDALGRCDWVHDIAIINRTAATAEQAARLSSLARVADESAVADCELLINTTPVGMGDDPRIPVDPSLLRGDLAVADIVYHPLETPLLAAARKIGAPVVDGLGMLVEQARLQQRLWTGVLPDREAMLSAARAQLNSRR